MLYDQPTKWPTRKIAAVIIAAFAVNGLIGIVSYFAPELAAQIPAREYVDALAAIIAGYMVRDRA